MSRIGRMPIQIPDGVKVQLQDDVVKVTGPKGTLQKPVPEGITVNISEKEVQVDRSGDDRQAKAYHGLTRALINNMVIGTSAGFTKVLEIQGTGYRANMQGTNLQLELGFSHPVLFTVPDGITVSVERNLVKVEGSDKELVGEVAAEIRSIRPPEPYKGKGVRYQDEQVRRKVGKKNV